MPDPPEICLLSAVEMARRIRTGELSARETLEAHLEQIDRVNPRVNAIVTLVADQARRRAREADEAQARGQTLGRLHGLPIAHKDLQPTRGIRTTFGSPIFRDFVPDETSPFIERLQSEGVITIGKTNTPEFGAGSQTFNEVFGATLNPWDLSKTCGGSSGGAAVALACHMLPIADGTDMGGSLRNPASFCNVVGLRPSTDQSELSVDGLMARSAADLAFFLSADSSGLERDVKGTRIAWWKDLGGIPVDARVKQIANRQRSIFESLGCIVEEAEPDLTGADEAFRTLRCQAIQLKIGPIAARHPGMLKETLLWELDKASRLTTNDIAQALLKQGELRQRMCRFLDRYEFFVLPVSQSLPFDVNLPWPGEIDGTKMDTYIDWMKSCYLISVLGTPAISVPAGFTAEGLPVGIQIVARHQCDRNLLQFAHAFQSAADLPKTLPRNLDPPA